jgi:hypothetical protein
VYQIFKFIPDQNGDYNYISDVLYRSKQLKNVNWQFVQENNYIILDEYIKGFVWDTYISEVDKNDSGLQTIQTDIFELDLLSQVQISNNSTEDYQIVKAAHLLSTETQLVSYLIFLDTIGKLLTYRQHFLFEHEVLFFSPMELV